MRKIASAVLFTTLLCGPALSGPELNAAGMPDLPKPVSQHKWLHRFVGNWESVAEVPGEPGKPPMKIKSTETFGMIGGFWVVGRNTCRTMGMEFGSVMTLGYDTGRKKYVGSWVDSSNSYMWKYEGSVKGATLTLDTEGPSPMQDGKMCKFREVTQFKTANHRVFTSSMLQDGKWVRLMKVDSYRRGAKK